MMVIVAVSVALCELSTARADARRLLERSNDIINNALMAAAVGIDRTSANSWMSPFDDAIEVGHLLRGVGAHRCGHISLRQLCPFRALLHLMHQLPTILICFLLFQFLYLWPTTRICFLLFQFPHLWPTTRICFLLFQFPNLWPTIPISLLLLLFPFPHLRHQVLPQPTTTTCGHALLLRTGKPCTASMNTDT